VWSLAGAGAVATVLAATTDPAPEGGDGGSYAATTLKPSGTWTAGGSTGAFQYSYPISVPPAASTLVPDISLAYDSGSVDGQTAVTQAQASWAGDGWSTPQSFVEQTFTSCSDQPEGSDAPKKTGDQCYAGPVLTLSLNGQSTPLVPVSGNTWKAASDSGEVVTHVVNSGNGSGTHDSDYWQVVDRSGTTYLLGRNQLPGWASGKLTTNSVDTVPVYSAHSNDPCYKSTGFADSVCTMAYRWNLDYVKDVHGNAMSYWYKQDTNFYGEFNGAHNVSYVRDSYLDHIDYGFVDGGAFGTVPNKVVFGVGDRCFTGTCSPLSSTNKANWPDVPFDLVCASGATCKSTGPSFFSTVRLTSITTRQYSTSAGNHVDVDSYVLDEMLPSATGDTTSSTLWLRGITHTGSDISAAAGTTAPITLPAVTFTATQPMANRVDSGPDGLPALDRYRVGSVTTESGSVITVVYDRPDPCTPPVTLTPATNTRSCYPVYWTPTGVANQYLDWFNKYAVVRVTQNDPTGGAPQLQTDYKFLGGAAWHFDDNEVVQSKYRTYGQFRGWGDVQTRNGNGTSDRQTLSETTYYRGMSKNNNSTVVNLTDSQGGVHEDVDQLAGQTLEKRDFLGDGGPLDHSTITSYWVSAATASRNRTGLPALTANWTAPVETFDSQAVTSGATTTWRYKQTDTSYHSATTDPLIGTVARTYSHTVPVQAAYDQCTSTSYAPVNTGANLVGLAAEVETDAVACAGFTAGSKPSAPGSVNTLGAPASVSRPTQVVSEERTFYDDPTFSATFPQSSAPAKGDVTMTAKAADYTGGAWKWQTTARSSYDGIGRPTGSWDANGNNTTTTYTTNSVGLTTAKAVKNPLGQTETTTLDPERGSTTTSTDINGVVTTVWYDALGRVLSTWSDSRSPATAPANYSYSYVMQNNGLTAVTTKRMNDGGGSIISTLIYDAMLRPRQTQTDVAQQTVGGTPKTGRLVTDTFYDSRGWKSASYNGWWDPDTTPAVALVSATNLHDLVPNQHFYTYDGLGRTVVDVAAQDGVEKSRTSTVYNGDRTTTLPPPGGITSATVTDPLGRTVELDQYTYAPALAVPADPFTGIWRVNGGTSTQTRYGFDPHGNQNTVTDSGTNTWTTTYDLLGRATGKSDPDAGSSALSYDGNGNLTESTDSRGKTVSSTYDALNRKTGEYAAPTASQSSTNQLAKWVYDNSDNAVPGMRYPNGHVTTTVAYWGGAAYTVQQKNFTIFGSSLGETVTIPASEGFATSSYLIQHTYSTNTGLLTRDIYPAAGGLPAETVNHGYDARLEMAEGVGSNLADYAHNTFYDAYGRVSQEVLGSPTGPQAAVTNQWDPHTGLLTDQLVTRTNTTTDRVDEQAYSYNQAGNITRQVSTRLGAASPTETQCYTYDGVGRLSTAWTATDACAATPTAASHATVGDSLGAGSAYWTTWAFNDPVGRASELRHAFTGGPASDSTTSYAYNGNGTGQPHTLTGTTGGPGGSTSYSYDKTGAMTARTTPAQGNQTLTWNEAGQLTAITTPGKGTSTFKYDADGNLLVQSDPGSTTLYLPGEQLVLNTAAGTTSGTRYYPLPGGGTAIRTGTATNAYQYQLTDAHGTPTLYLDNTGQTPTWRQSTPYGAPRGTAATWPDNRGFLDKPVNDTTGLSEVGARNYDPVTGRFISLDPVFDGTDPQQLNGYGYASNDPVNNSDPTGQWGFHINLGSVVNAIKKAAPVIAAVASVASIIPGPIGMVASGVAAAAYLVTGDYADAAIAAAGIALAAVGAGAAAVAAKAARAAEVGADAAKAAKAVKEGEEVAKAAKTVEEGEDVAKAGGNAEKADEVADAGRSEPRSCSVPNSFDPATPVLMADGSARPIRDVAVGDEVMAADPVAGLAGARAVTRLHDNQDVFLTDLTVSVTTLDGKRSSSVVHTTTFHPFWDVTSQHWVPAGFLRVGDELDSSEPGAVAVVAGVHQFVGHQQMLNLTVDDLHSYYVVTGNTPVLVHNILWPDGIPEIIHRAVAEIEGGTRGPRMVGSGRNVVDTYRGRFPALARKWGGSVIYQADEGNSWRILKHPSGRYGFIQNHNYDKVYDYVPKAAPGC
jgi:RHS repeat-associated protein